MVCWRGSVKTRSLSYMPLVVLNVSRLSLLSPLNGSTAVNDLDERESSSVRSLCKEVFAETPFIVLALHMAKGKVSDVNNNPLSVPIELFGVKEGAPGSESTTTDALNSGAPTGCLLASGGCDSGASTFCPCNDKARCNPFL